MGGGGGVGVVWGTSVFNYRSSYLGKDKLSSSYFSFQLLGGGLRSYIAVGQQGAPQSVTVN